MFCKYCGNEITPSQFCKYCGRNLVPTSEKLPSPDHGVHVEGNQQPTVTGGGASQIEANQVERVKTTLGGAQIYNATGQKVPDNKGRPLATKWVLIGAVVFIALGAVVMFSYVSAPPVPFASTVPSLASIVPSFLKHDKYVGIEIGRAHV